MERVTERLATRRPRATNVATPALDDRLAGSVFASSGRLGTCLPGRPLAGKAAWICPFGLILPMRAESVRTPGGRLLVRASTRARVGARQLIRAVKRASTGRRRNDALFRSA